MGTHRWLLLAAVSTCWLVCAHPATAQTPFPTPTLYECSTPNATIDSNNTTVVDAIQVTVPQTIAYVQVSIDIVHSFIGDLNISLSHAGTTVLLHSGAAQPFYPGQDAIQLIFDDAGRPYGSESFACGCHVEPLGLLSNFASGTGNGVGAWELTITDGNGVVNHGVLRRWCLQIFDVVPPPPPPPVTSLVCNSLPGTGVAQVAWTNPIAFDEIQVHIDGNLVATLPGTAFTFLSGALPIPSVAEMSVTGYVAGAKSARRSCLVGILGQVDLESCRNPGAAISEVLPEIDFMSIAQSILIGDLQVELDITHPMASDLLIDIASPLGTNVRLHNGGAGEGPDFDLIYWDFGLANGGFPYSCDCLLQPSGPGALADFSGETTDGVWRVTAQDQVIGNSGVLNSWCLRAFTNAPLLPVNDLQCAPGIAVGTVATTWTFPSDADSVEIHVNGVLEATLFGPFSAGNTGNYSTVAVASAGPVEVCVQPIVGGAAGPARCCTTGVELPAVSSLQWDSPAAAAGAVVLDWSNAAAYDAIDVTINGVSVATLPGSAVTYTTTPLTTLTNHEICVTPSSTFGAAPTACVHALIVPPTNIGACVSPVAPIQHGSPVHSVITIPDNELILDVAVSVSISHTFIGDLTVSVTSPSGTELRLHDQGGAAADDLVLLYANSGATSGTVPYDCGCPMRPAGIDGVGSLQDFVAEPSQGDWTLSVVDGFDTEDGVVERWCVLIPQSCGVSPPANLTCTVAAGDVTLAWSNAGAYDTIDVLRDGVTFATLPGTSTTIVDSPIPGRHEYQVVAHNVAQGCSSPSLVCEAVFGVTDVIFRGEGSGLIDSVDALQNALTAQGHVPLVIDQLTASNLAVPNSNVQALWLQLGTFPDNHSLTAAEGFLLTELHTGDIGVDGSIENSPLPIYIEGADVWGFDAPTILSSYDGVVAAQDGDNSLSEVVGVSSSLGFDLTPHGGTYSQDQLGNESTDRLVAASPAAPENGGTIAVPAWNSPLITGAYTVAVYYASNIAPVWCQSFEFGGHGGDQQAIAAIYRSALLGTLTPQAGDPFRRGDFDNSGAILINDPVATLVYLFNNGNPATCPDAADTNDDGAIGIADAVSSLAYLFGNAASPPAPGPLTCGDDPTSDSLPDCVYGSCP
ncbi:MAG: proprotein convertase P-domain-containing protein [Planctomycetota bacterium]